MDTFTPARLPHNEEGRLSRVHRTGMMDSGADQRFTLYTDLMRHISGYPVAYAGLIDEARQYFLSQNFPECMAGPECPRERTLCQFALLDPAPLIVPDMRAHPVLKVHPLVVSQPNFVSWAAFPLTTADGHILGTLCVLDYVPREVSAGQVDLMRLLAAELTLAIEVHVAAREAAAARVEAALSGMAGVAGLRATADAARFVRLCSGQPGSAADLAALGPTGLVDADETGHPRLTAAGRELQARLGLVPGALRVNRTVLDSDDMMTALLDLLGG